MLELEIPGRELFNEETQTFITTPPTKIRLEHSLVSLSKWEAKWKEPFLVPREKGFKREQIIDYVRCMTISQNVNPNVYNALTKDELEKINAYINDEKTATTFHEMENSRQNRQVVTSELIYYWMCVHQIPWEAQKWHLSRLLTLIRISNIKAEGGKKMSKSAIMSQNRKLNAERRAKYGTRG